MFVRVLPLSQQIALQAEFFPQTGAQGRKPQQQQTTSQSPFYPCCRLSMTVQHLLNLEREEQRRLEQENAHLKGEIQVLQLAITSKDKDKQGSLAAMAAAEA